MNFEIYWDGSRIGSQVASRASEAVRRFASSKGWGLGWARLNLTAK